MTLIYSETDCWWCFCSTSVGWRWLNWCICGDYVDACRRTRSVDDVAKYGVLMCSSERICWNMIIAKRPNGCEDCNLSFPYLFIQERKACRVLSASGMLRCLSRYIQHIGSVTRWWKCVYFSGLKWVYLSKPRSSAFLFHCDEKLMRSETMTV